MVVNLRKKKTRAHYVKKKHAIKKTLEKGKPIIINVKEVLPAKENQVKVEVTQYSENEV